VGNFRQILLALLQEPYQYLARELHSAMKGLVTYDGTLTEVTVLINKVVIVL